MLNREFEWKSAGKKTRIKDMSDTYLINVIVYVKTCRKMDNPSNVALLEFLMHEATHTRKLHKRFIEMGPFPFKLPDGNWAICERNRYKLIKLSHKTQKEPSLEFDEDVLSEDSLSNKFIYDVNEVLKNLKNVLKL